MNQPDESFSDMNRKNIVAKPDLIQLNDEENYYKILRRMMNLHKTEQENFENNQSLITRLFENSKNHLSISQIQNFAFSQESLNSATLQTIKDHLNECTKCKSQIEIIEQRKGIYQALAKSAE